jgi:hypothetical protein
MMEDSLIFLQHIFPSMSLPLVLQTLVHLVPLQQTPAVKWEEELSSVMVHVPQLLQQILRGMVLLVHHPQTPAVKQTPALFSVMALVQP